MIVDSEAIKRGADALERAFPTLRDDFTRSWFEKAAETVLKAVAVTQPEHGLDWESSMTGDNGYSESACICGWGTGKQVTLRQERGMMDEHLREVGCYYPAPDAPDINRAYHVPPILGDV